MTDQFYLQDSRSNVGDGLMFWAIGGGYTTDLDKAEVRTRAHAVSQHECRDTDIPWPKAYIDARAHTGVDCQYVSKEDAHAHWKDGCQVVLQVPEQWNGNDLIWAKWPIGGTARFDRAHRMTLEAAVALDDSLDRTIIWPLAYIESKTRRLVHAQDVSLKEALHGTGVRLTKPKKPRMMVFNCDGCGRFISDIQRYQNDCRNCGQDNRP